MTIPGLLTTLNNIKLKSQFKEGYSLLAQAVKMYNEDDERGDTYVGNTMASRKFYKTFMKYFKGATDCGYYADSENEKSKLLCLEGTTDSYYKNYSKTTQFISTLQLNDGQFYLPNNMLIMFDNNYADPFVSIDINGKQQKPNVWGYDVFTFVLKSSEKEGGYELVPMGTPGTAYSNLNTYCSKTNNSSTNGIACAYYAMQDEDYFKNLR